MQGDTMGCLKHKILNIISDYHLANLATVTEDGKPWTRYVIARADENMLIRCATFLDSRKVRHIAKNPEVHLACGVTDPERYTDYLQIQGRAEVSTDAAEKKHYWCDKLSDIFEGPDDERYGVIKIKPYRIELQHADSITPEIWEQRPDRTALP